MDAKVSSERKRARIGVQKTPEVSRVGRGFTPNKPRPSPRVRALRNILSDFTPVTNNEKDQDGECENPEKTQAKKKDGNNCVWGSFVTQNPSVTPRPSARWGHSITALGDAEAILIGGQGDKNQFCRDSVWQLNMNTCTWKVLETTSDSPKPEARMGHTAVYDHTVRSVYLFGGSKQKKWYKDVHVLDVDNNKWTLVKACGRAPTRAYHSCVLYRHELWIFGGVYPTNDSQPDNCSNDLHVFSPIDETWYAPVVHGEKPAPRSGHSATCIGNKIVIFGGWDAPICYNDLYIFDLCSMEFSKPEVHGSAPSPRSWHGSSILTGHRVLVYGGYNGNDALNDCFIFNLDTLLWTEVNLERPLLARAGHGLLYQPYNHRFGERDQIIVFGGGDNEGHFFRDIFNLMVPFESENILSIKM